MHPREAERRSGNAHTRLLEAVKQLGVKKAPEALEAARHRDPQVQALQERETLADLVAEAARESGKREKALRAAREETETLRAEVERLRALPPVPAVSRANPPAEGK